MTAFNAAAIEASWPTGQIGAASLDVQRLRGSRGAPHDRQWHEMVLLVVARRAWQVVGSHLAELQRLGEALGRMDKAAVFRARTDLSCEDGMRSALIAILYARSVQVQGRPWTRI